MAELAQTLSLVGAAGVTLYAAKDEIAGAAMTMGKSASAAWTKLINIVVTIGSVVAGTAGEVDASTHAPDGVAAPPAEVPAAAKPKDEKVDTTAKPKKQ